MQPFSASLDLSNLQVVCTSIESLSNDSEMLDEAMDKFQKFGVVVIQCSPGKYATNEEVRKNVLDLKPLFGNAAYHIRADADGVAPVGTFGADAAKPKYVSKMKVVKALSNDEFEPHTDASFQPKSDEILSLTCYQPATDGGESYVVSGAAIFNHIQKILSPSELAALFRPDAVTFQRGEEMATKAVLKSVGGRVHITWRRDIIIDKLEECVHPDAHVGVLAMDEFINNKQNQLEHKLQRNEVLLVNNQAVLHARRSFADGQIRRLDRLNFVMEGSGAKMDGRIELGFEAPLASVPSVTKRESIIPEQRTIAAQSA